MGLVMEYLVVCVYIRIAGDLTPLHKGEEAGSEEERERP